MKRRGFITALASLPFMSWLTPKTVVADMATAKTAVTVPFHDSTLMCSIPIPVPHGGQMRAAFDLDINLHTQDADVAAKVSDQIDFYFDTMRRAQGIPDVYDLPDDRDMTKAQYLAALKEQA